MSGSPLMSQKMPTWGFSFRRCAGYVLRSLILCLLLTDISLVPTAQGVTEPEVRFVNSVVQKHLGSTSRTDGLRSQVLFRFLFRECASHGATEPIYGLRDDD